MKVATTSANDKTVAYLSFNAVIMFNKLQNVSVRGPSSVAMNITMA